MVEQPTAAGQEKSLISVLTPTYNYGRFLQDCIDSVTQQLDPAVEHIVVNGDSDDATVSILRENERLGLSWLSEPDDGQSDALSKAAKLSSGEWLGWLNADEFYLPGAFAGTLCDPPNGVIHVYGTHMHAQDIDSARNCAVIDLGFHANASQYLGRGCTVAERPIPLWRRGLTRKSSRLRSAPHVVTPAGNGAKEFASTK